MEKNGQDLWDPTCHFLMRTPIFYFRSMRYLRRGFIFDDSIYLNFNLIIFIVVEFSPHLAWPGSRAARARIIIRLIFEPVERQLVLLKLTKENF